MEIEYDKQGWYIVRSESGGIYRCHPHSAYCTCPSTKKMCRHLKEIYTRLKDNGIGIENFPIGS